MLEKSQQVHGDQTQRGGETDGIRLGGALVVEWGVGLD